MTAEQAIGILRMSEQARWQSGVDHRDVETALDMAAAALRKQDAKEPVNIRLFGSTLRIGDCPTCGLINGVNKLHCDCGQKLAWPDGTDVTNRSNTQNESPQIQIVADALKHGFYGTMYGQKYAKGDKLIFIKPGEAWASNDVLFFRWGYPGPCVSEYKPEDYGKTWALTEDELTKEETTQ